MTHIERLLTAVVALVLAGEGCGRADEVDFGFVLACVIDVLVRLLGVGAREAARIGRGLKDRVVVTADAACEVVGVGDGILLVDGLIELRVVLGQVLLLGAAKEAGVNRWAAWPAQR